MHLIHNQQQPVLFTRFSLYLRYLFRNKSEAQASLKRKPFYGFGF
jgi:hypothetical protein